MPFETPKHKPEDQIKINNLDELKEKLGIDIPDGIDELEKPITVAKQELVHLRQQILTIGTPESLKLIKDFISESKQEILDTTKEAIDNFNKNFSSKEALEKGKNGADKLLKSITENTSNLTENIENNKTIKKASKAMKGGVKKITEAVKTGSFLSVLKKAKENGGILGFLAGLILSIVNMFGLGEKAEEAKEIAKKAKALLNPESKEFKETKEEVSSLVVEQFQKKTGITLDAESQKYLMEKLSPQNEGSYIDSDNFIALQEKLKSGKKITIQDIQALNIISKIYSDPEAQKIKDQLTNKLRGQIFSHLEGKFKQAGISLEGDSEGKFKTILTDEISNLKITEISKRKGFRFDGVEGIQSILGIGMLMPNILLRCYEDEIIEVKDLAIGVADYGTNTISVGLKGLRGGDIIPDLSGVLNWDDFDSKLEQLSPEKKLILLRAFYSEIGFVAGALGVVGFYGTSMLVSLAETGGKLREGITSPKDLFKNNPADRLGKTLKILGEKGSNGLWLTETKSLLEKAKESYSLVDKLKTPGITQKAKDDIIKRLGQISTDFDNVKGNLKTKDFLRKIGSNPLQTTHFKQVFEQLNSITKLNNTLGISIAKNGLDKGLLQARQFLKSFNIRYVNGQAILHIADGLKGKEFLKAAGALSPQILKGFMGSIPVILLGTTIYNEAMNGEGEFGKAFLALNGFAGGYMLLKDSEFNFENGFQAKNLGSASLGLFVIGTESFLVTKDTLKYLGKGSNPIIAAGKAIGKSIVRIPWESAKFIGWSIGRGAEALKIAKSFLQKSPKRGKLGVAVTLGLGALFLANKVTAEEINYEELQEKGYLEKDGSINEESLKNTFSQIDEDTKKQILTAHVVSKLPKSFEKHTDKISFHFEDNVFQISSDPDFYTKNEGLFQLIATELAQDFFDAGINVNIMV